jgi:hypothetical protein
MVRFEVAENQQVTDRHMATFLERYGRCGWDESSRVTAAYLYRVSTAASVRSSHSTEHSLRMSISLTQAGLKRAR